MERPVAERQEIPGGKCVSKKNTNRDINGYELGKKISNNFSCRNSSISFHKNMKMAEGKGGGQQKVRPSTVNKKKKEAV